MDNLRSEIANHFGVGFVPDVRQLVIQDGFDELEKERALKFFAEKSWQDVLRHLQGLKDDPIFGASYFLEEWAVLSREPLSYYLRAYLDFLLENMIGIYSADPDVEFVAYFVHELYQVFYMNKGNPFSIEQARLLKKVVLFVGACTKDRAHLQEDSSSWIKGNVELFLAELEKGERDPGK